MDATPFHDDHLVWLDTACHGRDLVGGKGASLSHLLSLGAQVPPAIGLTTRAYRSFAANLGLPCHGNGWTNADLADARARIIESPLPSTVADLFARAYAALDERLGNGLEVAVRSSAIDEDSAGKSFAGLHDTVLGVRGGAAFEAAVRRCWASLWTDRAMAYRAAATVEDRRGPCAAHTSARRAEWARGWTPSGDLQSTRPAAALPCARGPPRT